MLDIKLLGRFSVTRDGCLLDFPSRPSQLLLAYLLLNAGVPHPREALGDILWPDSSAANARANLRHALWQLRAALDDADDAQASTIVHNPHEIAFNRQSAYCLDVEELERERPVWTTTAFMEAAAAYGGELLPGFYEPWIVLERERLAAVFYRRMSRLIERLMAERRWEEVLVWAERWIGLDGAPEPAYQALMQAYAALGDVGQAVIVYRRCREALREQLGITPSPETRLLVEILTHGGAPPADPQPHTQGEDEKFTEQETVPPRPATGERAELTAALAQVQIEQQRANWYRLFLSLLAVVTAALSAALAARRRKLRTTRS